MAGLLTFIKDEYKKHWKAFLLLGVIACALQMIQIYALADYPTLTESIKALFSGDFNIRNIIITLIKVSLFIFNISIISTLHYSIILKGNISGFLKVAAKILLIYVLQMLCFNVYIAIWAIVYVIGVLLTSVSLGVNVFVGGISVIGIMILASITLIVPMLFIAFIPTIIPVAMIKNDMSILRATRQCCRIIYGYEYRSIFLGIIITAIALILIKAISVSMFLFYILSSLFIAINYIIHIYLYNYFEARTRKEKSNLFERAVEKLFSKYDIINHKI